jgi:2'-5' RNA ligase
MPMRRVFFALPLDPPLQSALAEIATGVANSADGRATRAASIHLTLAFIGDVDAARLPALVAVGTRLEGSAFTLQLDRLGAFRRAKVAWIAASTVPPALTALQATLVAALTQSGFATEARPFAPHVTLARHCARAQDPRAIAPALAWHVDAFALWASGGGRYEELARWPLLTG